MTAPFQPGDVVVCVDARPTPTRRGLLSDTEVARLAAFLRQGAMYRIAGLTGFLGTSLRLVGQPEVSATFFGGYNPARFRKIDEEQIPEVLERLKSLGKVRERVS
jgi:hypothetical protein